VNSVHLAGVLAIIAGFSSGLGVLAGQGDERIPRGTVPMQIPYQGVLERNGQLVNAIGSDTVSFRVSLYDAPAAGQKVWPSDPSVYDEHTVNVYNGRFSFSIGSDPQVPYQHVADTPKWLEIQVKGPDDPDFVQLGGRQQFQSAPYAVAAERADTDFLVPGSLTVEGAASVQSALDVDGPITAPTLEVSGEATVDRLTFSTSGSSMWRLAYDEYSSTLNLYEAGCPVTEFGNCRKMQPTSYGACFLSSNHGDVSCEIAKGNYQGVEYWWLASTAFAGHLRQCKAICLKWN
jgi:hypothetical protein